MERANANGGTNRASINQGQGAGQGSMAGRREFQPAHHGFHPGYAGRGPYTGEGGGRYGARSCYGGWAPQNRGSSFDRRGRGIGRDIQGAAPLNRDNVQHNQVETKAGQGASTETVCVSVGGMNINLPAQAATLLQQALSAMQETNTKSQVSQVAGDAVPSTEKGKSQATLQHIEKLSSANETQEVPESSQQAARKDSGGKLPYCYRCKTKGHAIEVCHAELFCEICESRDHIKARCPKYRAEKKMAVPCGYAVEGLGFFHITHDQSQKERNEVRTALVRVTDGELSVSDVVSELERLIPGGWKWKVEEIGMKNFKTVFPSKAELLRMVEWGVVQTKVRNAKFQIEERVVDNEVKYVLPTVWVQFTGLPLHLRDYQIMWAVGSILGVTRDADMVFTRRFDITRIQVMVINPNLIPQSVNVVIGENLYELKFRVEANADDNNPQPMDMDRNDQDDEAKGKEEDANEKSDPKYKATGGNRGTAAANSKGANTVARNATAPANKTYYIQLPGGSGTVSEEELRNSSGAHVGVEEQDNHEQEEEEEGCNQNDMVDDEMNEEYNLKDILEEEMNEDNLSQSGSINSAEIEKDLQEWEVMMEKEKMENEKPSVEDLAAIPEASPAQASARRGKRRADDDGAEVAAKAERLKALRNEVWGLEEVVLKR